MVLGKFQYYKGTRFVVVKMPFPIVSLNHPKPQLFFSEQEVRMVVLSDTKKAAELLMLQPELTLPLLNHRQIHSASELRNTQCSSWSDIPRIQRCFHVLFSLRTKMVSIPRPLNFELKMGRGGMRILLIIFPFNSVKHFVTPG